MDYKSLAPGAQAPEDMNAVVEIPKGEGTLKYEFRTDGTIVVDRIRKEQIPYPVHYCGIPATLAPDGDPLDILILGNDKWKTGDVVRVRPVAVFWMTDEKGIDPKIVAVPREAEYDSIRSLVDVPVAQRQEIENFFREYKKDDIKGKWSESNGWEDLPAAHKTIRECIGRWNKTFAAEAPQPPSPKN